MLQREQICETFKSERDAHFGPQRVNPEKSDLAVTANFRECIQKSHSSHSQEFSVQKIFRRK